MASYDAFIKQLTNPRYLRRDLKISDIKGPRVPNIGVPRVTYKDGDIVGLDPMSTISSNENIIPGGALPLAGAVAATQLPDLIDKIDSNVLNKMMWTPAGIVLAPEVKEEAKPKIETFPSGEKQETSLITETPTQTKTDIGSIPPITDTKIPGLQVDKGIDTNILFNRKPDIEKQKIVENTFIDLKEKLGRDPSITEVADKLKISTQSTSNFLRDLDFNRQVGSSRYASFKEVGDPKVKKIINTSEGVKWPDQETKDSYEAQIIQRYKYPTNSAELRKKYETKELLTNEELVKKYGINLRSVENINSQIKKDYNLDKPVLGREETRKEKELKRKEARELFTDINLENKISGNNKVHLGHLSDLYNRKVYAETLGYTPVQINEALSKSLDPILKTINEKQDELIKNKPSGWKEKLEEYNVKGINYAALSNGYKTFETTNPNTLEKKPVLVDYGKTIDPTGVYEGKSIKEIAKETNLLELNKIEKAFSDSIKGNEVKNPELLTEENFNKLKNYRLFEINRKATLEAQTKKPKSEIKDLVKNLEKIKNTKYATGGRVGLKQGGEPTGMYYQEIPDVDPEIIIHKQIMNEDDPVRVAALEHRLDMYRKQQAQEEKQRQEYKQAQKDQGIKYLEDFPTQGEYLKESAKQLLTNPGYFYGKALKGAVEGTEWLVGQPAKILFNQEGKNWDWYHPVAGEKLGIDSLINKYKPKEPTTLTEAVGTAAEIGGTFMDPFLAYGIGKRAIGGIKSLPTEAKIVEETIDPTRRDLVKMMGVGAAAAALGPTLSKFSKIKTPTKVAEGVRASAKLANVTNMPEWFPSLVSKIQKEGKFPTKDYATVDNVKIKELSVPSITGKNETYRMTEYPNGKIEIEANVEGGAYGQPFEIHYKPPEAHINETTGKVINEPGEFSVLESRPRPDPNDIGNWELDYDTVAHQHALSDIDRVEEVATGKVTDLKTAEERRARRNWVESHPYEDVMDRYPDPDIADWWEVE
jgi:hypothetical protein